MYSTRKSLNFIQFLFSRAEKIIIIIHIDYEGKNQSEMKIIFVWSRFNETLSCVTMHRSLFILCSLLFFSFNLYSISLIFFSQTYTFKILHKISLKRLATPPHNPHPPCLAFEISKNSKTREYCFIILCFRISYCSASIV